MITEPGIYRISTEDGKRHVIRAYKLPRTGLLLWIDGNGKAGWVDDLALQHVERIGDNEQPDIKWSE